MVSMNIFEIEKKATELMGEVGGKIFAFPINEQDPFSLYAVTMWTGAEFKTFPQTFGMEEAASGIKHILDTLKKEGLDSNYERLVRFVSYEAQINAPSVTMRRLKKGSTSPGYLKDGVDITPTKDGYNFSGRGLVKFSYLQMMDDDLPNAAQFMNKYYELLAMKRYGKTAAAIKQEVRRMKKDAAVKWIEQTYAKYIHDPMEVMNIMQTLKA
jgi:hypothetical protein